MSPVATESLRARITSAIMQVPDHTMTTPAIQYLSGGTMPEVCRELEAMVRDGLVYGVWKMHTGVPHPAYALAGEGS